MRSREQQHLLPHRRPPVMGYRFDFFDALKKYLVSNTDNGQNTMLLTAPAYVSTSTDVSSRL